MMRSSIQAILVYSKNVQTFPVYRLLKGYSHIKCIARLCSLALLALLRFPCTGMPRLPAVQGIAASPIHLLYSVWPGCHCEGEATLPRVWTPIDHKVMTYLSNMTSLYKMGITILHVAIIGTIHMVNEFTEWYTGVQNLLLYVKPQPLLSMITSAYFVTFVTSRQLSAYYHCIYWPGYLFYFRKQMTLLKWVVNLALHIWTRRPSNVCRGPPDFRPVADVGGDEGWVVEFPFVLRGNRRLPESSPHPERMHAQLGWMDMCLQGQER